MERYSTDNGIYNSKKFTRELNGKGQVIRHSRVGGHHHNVVAYNSIKNVVRIARIMMICDAPSWSDASEKSLCPMSTAHYVDLQNHTPHIYSGMYT